MPADCATILPMENRLAGIVATLWFFFALLSLFLALAFSPIGLRSLLPGPHPITWICPVLLAMPPMALAYRLILGRAVPRLCLWAVAILLAAFGFLLVVFVVTTFVGH